MAWGVESVISRSRVSRLGERLGEALKAFTRLPYMIGKSLVGCIDTAWGNLGGAQRHASGSDPRIEVPVGGGADGALGGQRGRAGVQI